MNTPAVTARRPHPAPELLDELLAVDRWLGVVRVARFVAVDATAFGTADLVLDAGAAAATGEAGTAATAPDVDDGATAATVVLPVEWAPRR